LDPQGNTLNHSRQAERSKKITYNGRIKGRESKKTRERNPSLGPGDRKSKTNRISMAKRGEKNELGSTKIERGGKRGEEAQVEKYGGFLYN